MREKLSMINFSESQKKMLKMLAILIGAFVLIIIIISIIKSVSGRKVSYEQLERIMVRATTNYVEDNGLDNNELYGTTNITVDTLASKGYMKKLNKYVKDSTSCSASVDVYKNLDYYNYIPKINCGNDYNTKSLGETITNEKNLVTKGNGLYKENDNYIYRGEYVDNYVSFSGSIWRIIGIKNNEIKLIQQSTKSRSVWDDRYNVNYDKTIGITDFEGIEASRIKNALINAYNSNDIISKDAKSYIVPKQLCIGKRSEDDTSKDNSVECSTLSEYMGVGLITISDFLNASLDPNCINIDSEGCINYNYLTSINNSYWTLTSKKGDTGYAYYISSLPYLSKASASRSVNLVLYVNGNINYTSGSGTELDPYIVEKED